MRLRARSHRRETHETTLDVELSRWCAADRGVPRAQLESVREVAVAGCAEQDGAPPVGPVAEARPTELPIGEWYTSWRILKALTRS